MSIRHCTHSALVHFLYPICPQQSLADKITKLFLLIIGVLVCLYSAYRAVLRRHAKKLAQLEAEECERRRLEYKLFQKQERTRQIETTVQTLETKGAPLTSSRLFCCFDFLSQQFPYSLVYVRASTHSLTALPENYPPFEKFLAIPCLVTGWSIDHITLFLLEKMANGSYQLEFFDSKGYSIERNLHAKHLKEHLGTFFEIRSVTENTKRFQKLWDRSNCGIYICWYLEQHLAGKTTQEMPPPDIEAYRLKFAERMKKCPTI